MHVEPASLIAIGGMALVTYVTRAGGLWLMGRVRPTRRVEAGLRHIPGAVLVSIVAPTILTSESAEALVALIVVLVAARTRSILLAMIVGVVAVWLLRHLR